MTASQNASSSLSAFTPTLPMKDMANAIRALSMDAVEKANSGHPGMPMGMADVATVLFSKFLKFNPDAPLWHDRDRFVLSAGHGSMLLYSLLYLTGYEKITLDEIKNFRQMGSLCAGHPEVMQDAGIETTTGPLGQGIATAVGMALAERILQARFGEDLCNHKTYVIASDGDLMEGISHEAASLAGHLGLNDLVVLYDDNGISIDGPTKLSFTDDTLKRFESYGWRTLSIDGHDMEQIDRALTTANAEIDRPVLIACKTKIGFGAPTKENTSSSHGSPLGENEIAGAKKNLGWEHEAFDIPAKVKTAWESVSKRGRNAYDEWLKRYEGAKNKKQYDAQMTTEMDEGVIKALEKFITKTIKAGESIATRKASGKVLETLDELIPSLIGGSADLTGSNITKVNDAIVSKENFDGRYIYYGVREHAMAAMMNGLSLHGGFIPYGGTFLCFSDYSRPAIRLAALMKTRAIHVMTHDSIGLGEDGPTHQPVEHLAALRAIPNCYTFRPADMVETAESWYCALTKSDAPSVLALTRQNLPNLREKNSDTFLTLRGAYVLREAEGEHKVTIFASGSEVEIAVNARDILQTQGVGTRVVSVPCYDLMIDQGDEYISELIGDAQKTAVVEAAGSLGWHRVMGRDGVFIGMNSFGESAPYEELYEHFGITAENTAEQILKAL